MPSFRQTICVALLVLAACSTPQRVNVKPDGDRAHRELRRATSRLSDVVDDRQAMSRVRAWKYAEGVQRVRDAAALIKIADAVKAQVRTAKGALVHPPVTASASLSDVAQCIKDHESGNYTESSHPSDGSGAYQFIPGTWQAWFARWKATVGTGADGTRGYTFVTYAYQAPPWIQDAVLEFTLTHGGAGNWSPRFGNDPCTVGMGG